VPTERFGSPSDRGAARKTEQLCREVRDVLSVAVAALDDPALFGVWVVEVRPAPDASHLRVVVVATGDADLDAVHEALARANGVLRSEVAAGISRKRTPLLSYQVEKETES
jgi:ribosome-binding factor A